MVVWGFGAAGSEGKASSARTFGGAGPRPRDCEDDDEEEAVHEGAEAVVDARDDEDADGVGREGNADAAGALDEEDDDDDAATQPGGPREAVGVGPPSRVLFLSFKTLFEFRCEGATSVNPALAAAALAQPLELEVAPCMPLRPGKLG